MTRRESSACSSGEWRIAGKPYSPRNTRLPVMPAFGASFDSM